MVFLPFSSVPEVENMGEAVAENYVVRFRCIFV
jgi:hypothetical protein